MFKFKQYQNLSDGEIELVLNQTDPPDAERGRVPQYKFSIRRCSDQQVVGGINLRIGEQEFLHLYSGHIGYGIDEAFRGNRYAAKACRLVQQVALDHGMQTLWITCSLINPASARTCELVGATFVGLADLPAGHDLYKRGWRQVRRYRWVLEG